MLGVAAAAEAMRSRFAAMPSSSIGAVPAGIAGSPAHMEYLNEMLRQQDFNGRYSAAPSPLSTLVEKLGELKRFTMVGDSGGSSSQVSLLISLLLVAITMLFYQVLAAPRGLKPPKGTTFQTIRSWVPSLGQISFYGSTRSQWVKTHMGSLGTPQDENALRMNLSKYVVSIVHGMDGAKDFFSSRHLNFYAGFAALFSGLEIPDDQRNDEDDDGERKERKIDIWSPPPSNGHNYTLWQIKHLRNCLTNERLTEHDVMAKIARDCWRGITKIWAEDGVADVAHPSEGATGLIDMHKQLYAIMFRLSVRIVGATEMAELEDLSDVMKAYWFMENNQSFTNTLLSKMPTPTNRMRKSAARELQRMLKEPIEKRVESEKRHEDYVQTLLDLGASVQQTTQWVTMVLFASIINTSSIFAWTLALSSANPAVWKRLQDEVDETLDRLATANGIGKDAPVVDKIAAMSIEQLEENFAFTYWCIRETIRMFLVDFSYRRVDSRDDSISLGGQKVRRGEYMAFALGTIHYDARIYSSPEKYDPERWERGEASKPFEFMGWGGGSHPCIGMKLAKNELKMAIAMMVACNSVKPVDLDGHLYAPDELPLPDLFRGGYRLPSKPLRLQYTVRKA